MVQLAREGIRNLLGRASGANVGAYRLYGSNDVAAGNFGFDAPHFADPGVTLSSNQTASAPHFDSISCAGFHTNDPIASHYGRYAQ